MMSNATRLKIRDIRDDIFLYRVGRTMVVVLTLLSLGIYLDVNGIYFCGSCSN